MDRTARTPMAFLAAAWLIAALSVRAEAPPVVAIFAEGRLSVTATDAPLDDVVREVARAVGAEVKGAVHTPKQVTLAFEDTPLEDGLRRVLGEQPFSLRYQGERLRAIELVDVGSPARRYPATAAPGVPLANGDRYFPPPEPQTRRNPTPQQIEAAKAEYQAAQRPLEEQPEEQPE